MKNAATHYRYMSLRHLMDYFGSVLGGAQFTTERLAIGANEHCCGFLRVLHIIPQFGNPSPDTRVGACPTFVAAPDARCRQSR